MAYAVEEEEFRDYEGLDEHDGASRDDREERDDVEDADDVEDDVPWASQRVAGAAGALEDAHYGGDYG